MNYNDVRQALGDAIQVFNPELNVYYYTPRTLVPPAAIVKPQGSRSIEYIVAYTPTSARWYFDVVIVIGKVNEQSAQDQAGDLVSPGSDLIRELTDTDLGGGHVEVLQAAISESMFGTGLYTYAQLSLVAFA